MLMETIVSDEAAAWFTTDEGWRAAIRSRQHCPVCGVVVWAGVKRRSDAIYCSDKCRVAAARLRASGGSSSGS
jgi:hypothetical protein